MQNPYSSELSLFQIKLVFMVYLSYFCMTPTPFKIHKYIFNLPPFTTIIISILATFSTDLLFCHDSYLRLKLNATHSMKMHLLCSFQQELIILFSEFIRPFSSFLRNIFDSTLQHKCVYTNVSGHVFAVFSCYLS